MAGTTSPAYDRMIEILKDGIWRDREWVITEIGKAIPPGVALRRSEELRRNSVQQRKRKGLKVTAETARKIQRSNDYLITAGRRNMALTVLQSARVEQRETPEGEVRVRLLPPRTHHNTLRKMARDAARGVG